MFFFNTKANITVNTYQTDKNIVKNYIAPYIPEIALDADLNDWDLEATKLAGEEDSANGNAMSVYAYRNDSGLYLAYEVKHSYQPRVYMWNEGSDERGVWYFNTNAEFWVNDNHFVCTAFGDSGYVLKTMKTTEDMTSGSYTTVLEAFIPEEIAGNAEASLGFAFKTCDENYAKAEEITDNNKKFNGDPWWFFAGQFPTDVESRFSLK